MTISKAVLAILVTTSMVFGATLAWAGHATRPDLGNVDTTFYDDDDSNNSAEMNFTNGDNSADGSIYRSAGDTGQGSPTDAAGIGWDLYAPDKVKRSETKGKISQKNWVKLGIYTYEYNASPSSYSASAKVEDCSAKADFKVDKNNGLPTSAKWSLKCKNLDDTDMVDDDNQPVEINLPPRVLARMALLFDKKVIDLEKGKINIKGSAKDSGLPPLPALPQ